METRQIIANQRALRQAFLSEKLAPSEVGEVTEVKISKDNNRICSGHIPAKLEKRVLTIPDLDTLKEIAGTPDELHQMNAVQWNQKVEELSDKFDLSTLREHNNDNEELVCRLMNQYVYGDSDGVKACKELLARVYFPMEVAYYGNEKTDLVVDANTNCYIGEEGKTSVCQFRNIILNQGSCLVYNGIVDISADNLTQLGDASKTGNFVSIGQSGGDGGNGAAGGKGADGAPTQNGTDGMPGSSGSDGEDGKKSGTVTARIEKISGGMIYVCSIGGNGGNGGNGGKGGNAGDSAEVFIYCNSPEKITMFHTAPKGGNGGDGGSGGDGGKGGNGDGGSSGTSGTPGASGKAGAAGAAGKEGAVNILPYDA